MIAMMGNPRSHDSAASTEEPILLFDGVCNLCNGFVKFVFKHERAPALLRFSPLQSHAGQRMLRLHGLSETDLQTFVLIETGTAYTRSTAALRLMRWLKFPWRLAYGFIIVPRPIRDWVYRYVARNRYRWFGKRESCMIAPPNLEARFIQN